MRPLKRTGRFWCRMGDRLCIACILVFANAAGAADAPQPEYAVKAAYIYNFASFTEWPAETPGQLKVCVYGTDPFGEALEALRGKPVGERTLAVARLNSVENLGECQIVFLAREVLSNLPRILDAIGERGVLTIADEPGAMRDGVAINMRQEGERVTFEVNLSAVHRQRLSLSFRLLRLAAEVRN
jgi:hypothetical protein